MTSTPSNPPEKKLCTECGEPVSARYCGACGMKVPKGPLTFRGMFRDVLREVLDLESPLIRTFIQLFYRPGGVASDYMAGKRRSLTNPAKYLIIAGVMLLIGDPLTDLLAGQEVDTATIMFGDTEMLEDMRPFLEFYSEYFALITILSLPILAAIMRVFLWNDSRTTMGYFVLSLYVYGHAIYFQLILQLMILIHPAFAWVGGFFVYAFYTFAMMQFSRRPKWESGVLSLIGHLVVYTVALALVGGVGGFVYAISAKVGEERNAAETEEVRPDGTDETPAALPEAEGGEEKDSSEDAVPPVGDDGQNIVDVRRPVGTEFIAVAFVRTEYVRQVEHVDSEVGVEVALAGRVVLAGITAGGDTWLIRV